jgi:nucleotide-binding universal stress UspA family protein
METQILPENLDRATAYLAGVTQRPELAGIKCETVVLVGYPAEMILNVVQSGQADVIVLCSHGRTGLLRWVLGSAAQRIVHQAPVPVLVLHQQGPAPTTDDQRPLRALVPLDGSWLAEAALGSAATLVSLLAPQGQRIVHLVRVVKSPPVESEAAPKPSPEARAREAALLEAQDYLSRTAEYLQRGPLAQLQVETTWSALVDQDVAGALVNLAQRVPTATSTEDMGSFDLIAMATHGRGGLHRWVMGSVTERVLSATKLPLLVIRPQEVIVTNRLNAEPSIREMVLT